MAKPDAPKSTAVVGKMLSAMFIAVLILTTIALESIAQQPPTASDTAEATSKLFEAIQNNNMSGVRTAIAIGASTTATNEWGMTAADMAVEKGYFDIAHFLLSVRDMRSSELKQTPVSPPDKLPPTTPLAKTSPPVEHQQTIPIKQVPADPEEVPTPWPAGKPNPFDPNAEVAANRLPIIGKVEDAAPRPAAPLGKISGFPGTPRPVAAPQPVTATSTPIANPEQPGFFGRVIDSVIPDWLKGDSATETTPAADVAHVAEQTPAPAPVPAPTATPVPTPAPAQTPVTNHASDNAKSKPRSKPSKSKMRQPETTIAESHKSVKRTVLSPAGKTDPAKKNDSIFDKLSNFLLSDKYDAKASKAKTTTKVVGKTPPPPTRRPKPTKPVKTASLPTNHLSGIELTIGKSAKLGQPLIPDKMSLIKRPGASKTMADCVSKKQGALVFCIEPINWPEKMKSYFLVDSIIYQGAKTVVRYDNGRATFFHTLFPSSSFKVTTSYYQRVLGPPSNIWKRSIAPLAAPRRENPTYIWKSVNPVTKQITTLEIRKFDDARGGFPDTGNGVIMLYGDSSLPIFPQLSTIETMLINSNVRAK